MKTRWTELLSEEVYTRLANCKTRKEDILPLAQAKWAAIKAKTGFDKEDALISILELLDCNSFNIDITIDEYNDIISKII